MCRSVVEAENGDREVSNYLDLLCEELKASVTLRHRGPDWSELHCHGDCYLAHQRLAIVDPASGDQPLYNEDKTVIVTVNGEIYNHKQLRETLKGHRFRTGSDCEVIAHLYEEHGEEFVDMLDGMFSFVLLDTRDDTFMAARDAIGITPLYMGWGVLMVGSIWFASEMKAISDDCERFISFPPGHLALVTNNDLVHKPTNSLLVSKSFNINLLRSAYFLL
ncbi:putative asparagine synthase (glutamine-hydrolyzing) [Rosa chinensis]|uniref:Putative asparagine synthase (Glutamine-hydrolyzing) n=1 Tax=Rosa chinensis TaxID=74649 RepID=A0A2P6RQL7_ROSCH|nr:putative asparagine synthase (glutamine-hydrolyzing) [Rosa chinensis]